MVEGQRTSAMQAPSWRTFIEEVRQQVSRQQFETWFRQIRPISMDENVARIGVPSTFLRNWLQNYYVEVMDRALHSATGGHPVLELVVGEGQGAEEREGRSEAPPKPPPARSSGTTAGSRPARPVWASDGGSEQVGLRWSRRYPNFLTDVHLNEQYTFENFIVGPTNKLPHAAALAVAEQPASAYNPLFLHGSVGLGKTHLLQAICHSVIGRGENQTILFLSCETFTNHFIAAVKKGDLKAFRHRYRHVDILVIDDIHFLQRKEQTQEEFFHTFNTLYNSGKQIVLSSDSPPKEIPTLEERLVSRFKWGLVAEIETPDFETRMLIVKRKAQLRGHAFSNEVCEYVADHFTENVRELEGAILKVISVADLHQVPVNVEVARNALKGLLAPAKRKITIDRIIEVVTRFYDVKPSDIQSRKRSKSIAFPRQICMFVARKLTNHSLEEIGGFFGGRDHTTVIYAMDKIGRLQSEDRHLKQEIEGLMEEIRS